MKKTLAALCLLTASLFILTQPAHAYHKRCLTASFWIEDSVYDFFDPTQNPESQNTFEQWADKQMNEWNRILSLSGAKDCFQMEKIVRVPDSSLPLNGGLATNTPNVKDRTIDIQWGFPASSLRDLSFMRKILNQTEWGLLHELSHARYLIDEYGFDVDTERDDILVKDPSGKSIVGNYIKPVRGSVVHENKARDLMTSPSNYHFYSPHSAIPLNLIAGRHQAEQFGNFAGPENFGIYLNDLPANNILKILDNRGQPLTGAEVLIYQSIGNGEVFGKRIDNISDIVKVTGQDGKVSLGRNPFGGNQISKFHENTVLIMGIITEKGNHYKFMEVSDFNLAYWLGAKREAVYEIKTDIPPLSLFDKIKRLVKPSHRPTLQLTAVFQIDRVTPNPVKIGQELQIRGSGLGEEGEGEVELFDQAGQVYKPKVVFWGENIVKVIIDDGLIPAQSKSLGVRIKKTIKSSCQVADYDQDHCNMLRGCTYYECSNQCFADGTPTSIACQQSSVTLEEAVAQICKGYDGDVKNCDKASVDCAYFFCTNQCWPEGTSLETGCAQSRKSESSRTSKIISITEASERIKILADIKEAIITFPADFKFELLPTTRQNILKIPFRTTCGENRDTLQTTARLVDGQGNNLQFASSEPDGSGEVEYMLKPEDAGKALFMTAEPTISNAQLEYSENSFLIPPLTDAPLPSITIEEPVLFHYNQCPVDQVLIPTITADPSCTDEFQYNECSDCNLSRPKYKNTCTERWSAGEAQEDKECSSWCNAALSPGLGGLSTDTTTTSSIMISDYADFRETGGEVGKSTIVVPRPETEEEKVNLEWRFSPGENQRTLHIKKILSTSTEESTEITLTTDSPITADYVTIAAKVPRKVERILINGQEVKNLDDPALSIHLPGTEGQYQEFTIPVLVEYSTGEIEGADLTIVYNPQVERREGVGQTGTTVTPGPAGEGQNEGAAATPNPSPTTVKVTPTPEETPQTCDNLHYWDNNANDGDGACIETDATPPECVANNFEQVENWLCGH